MKQQYKTASAIIAVIAVLAIAQWALQTASSAQSRATVQAPMYQVDPFWPKPLPNNWVLGSVVGLSIDSRDHIWITHRGNVAPKEAGMVAGTNGMQQPGGSPPPQPGDKRRISEICCDVAPPILEFDMAGNLVSSWGGPGAGYQWPTSMHGVTVDGKDNVWLTTNQGHQMLKFTRQGKFLLQVGREGQSKGNTDTANLNRAAEAEVDLAANEVYVADGYGNRRVIVFDADTGAYKRHWGAYGAKPDDVDPGPYDPAAPLPKVFRTVHCAQLANDGLVYVCDRANNRIQVFRKDGTFVKETQIAKNTLGDGVDLRHRVLERQAAAPPVHLRRREPPHLDAAARSAPGREPLRQRRTRSRAVLRAAQRVARLERQHLHGRNLRGQAAAEVQLQGHRSGDGDY